MDYFLCILVGYFISQLVTAFKVFKLTQLPKHRTILNKPHVFKLFIEEEHDNLYLYEYEKNEFVCQAKTVTELATLAKEYNKITYAAVLYKEDCIMFVNGTVKEVNES